VRRSEIATKRGGGARSSTARRGPSFARGWVVRPRDRGGRRQAAATVVIDVVVPSEFEEAAHPSTTMSGGRVDDVLFMALFYCMRLGWGCLNDLCVRLRERKKSTFRGEAAFSRTLGKREKGGGGGGRREVGREDDIYSNN